MDDYILIGALVIFFGIPLLLFAGTVWLYMQDLRADNLAKRTDFPRMELWPKDLDRKPNQE